MTHVACLVGGRGVGTTDEQLIKSSLLCPMIAKRDMTSLKASDIFVCWLTKLCHVQAVRVSRAMRKSDWRRISPLFTPELKGRGDMASPTMFLFHGYTLIFQ